MKFSETWLRTFVDPAFGRGTLSPSDHGRPRGRRGRETVAPPFTGVVVAEVLEVSKHPDADRLNVCRSTSAISVMVRRNRLFLGAPTLPPGCVPCALPGAVLPGDFTIKLAKVRGIESSGMLCSAKELGLADDATGLLVLPVDAPVGCDIRDCLTSTTAC